MAGSLFESKSVALSAVELQHVNAGVNPDIPAASANWEVSVQGEDLWQAIWFA